MRDNSKMEATISKVKWYGQMGIVMKADGKRERCKEEVYLNIMKDLS